MQCERRRAGLRLAHPRRDQRERVVGLHDDEVILAGEPLAVHRLHRLPGPRVKRIADRHLERRTPGIVTLPRPGSAKAGSPARSATKRAATIARCSITACHDCSMRLRWHVATDDTRACSRPCRASIC